MLLPSPHRFLFTLGFTYAVFYTPFFSLPFCYILTIFLNLSKHSSGKSGLFCVNAMIYWSFLFIFVFTYLQCIYLYSLYTCIKYYRPEEMSAKSKVDILEDLGVLGYLFIYFSFCLVWIILRKIQILSLNLGKRHILVQK